MSYILQRKKTLPNGKVTETLSAQGEWCIATLTPMRFFNPRKASLWALQNLEVEKLHPFIAGPNGGQYKVSSGKIKLTGKNI